MGNSLTKVKLYKDLYGRNSHLGEIQEAEERKLTEPWRTLPKGGNWNEEYRNKLVEDIKQQQAYGNLPHVRIVFLGPVMSGKSSFINTVATIDQGRISLPMDIGEEMHSLSKALLQYKPKNILKNFVLMDVMGLEDNTGQGFNVQDLIYILEGRVQLKYNFNPISPMTDSDPRYKSSPTPADKTHCTVLVIPAPIIHTDAISDSSKKKIETIKEYIRSKHIPILIILTKIDLVDEEVKKDITKVYDSRPIKTVVTKTKELYGIPDINIFPVRNYSCESSLDHNMDILALLALLRMMEIAHDRLQTNDDNRDDEEVGAMAKKQDL